MGRTESAFAGILLLAIIAAVTVVVMRSGTRAPVVADVPEQTAILGTGLVSFTGNADKDLCTCYEQAFAYGKKAGNIESVEYRGGFAACSNMLGADGGNAWTWGWANGQQAPGKPSTCRGYYASLRSIQR